MSQSFFSTPIGYLKGVGPERAALLEKELGIKTFGDLLYHFPFRYVDRSKFYKVKEITPDLPYVQLKGTITSLNVVGHKPPLRLVGTFKDDTGTLDLLWFKGVKWMQKLLQPKTEYVIFGKPAIFNKKFNIVHPEVEIVSPENILLQSSLQAVYNTTDKLRTKSVDSRAIQRLQKVLVSQLPPVLPETLSGELIQDLKMMPLREALLQVHFPENLQQLQKAEFRLKFEELFYNQLRLLMQKLVRTEKYVGMKFSVVGDAFNNFYKHKLPFQLTNAQKRVIKEIRADAGSGKQMNRLLQGDVGSGKTLVAYMSMLISKDNGYQSAMMAPTEILAQQHYRTISKLANPATPSLREGETASNEEQINIALLTGSTKAAERKPILKALAEGTIDILIGTHALIEDAVQFKNLGLVVIDEQHRFGVEQRARLWTKSPIPALAEGKGENTAPHFDSARKSIYPLIKELQEENKRLTTESEAILWQYLKEKNLEQYKFRHQHIIDQFIVDFVCLSKKLVIEIDGGYNTKPEFIEADKLRTQILNELGFKVIRFKNEEVLTNIDTVLKKIIIELNALPSVQNPNEVHSLPLGEGRGGAPHVLVMTATPIPRTLAMTLYGDLDVSVIDEMPPGRKPVNTVHRYDASRIKVFGFLKEQIAKGRQIYIVYPLIEESETLDYKDLTDGFDAITREFPRPQYHVSMVHGRMKPADKEFEMQRFIKGETHIMVATTVIEVGVDVPNASVMVIESAERFGLAQLHQLRGRVGRGAEQSYCILMSSHKLSKEAKLRIDTMVETNDGFRIAETDLRLRGAGDIQGTQQSGILDMKIADIAKDVQILQAARNKALDLLGDDPHLAKPHNAIIRNKLKDVMKAIGNWSRVS